MVLQLVAGIVLVLACCLADAVISAHANAYVIDVIVNCGVYIILAVGLNLVNGFTGQFSIGAAGFFGIGAYASAALTVFGQTSFLARFFHDGSPVSPLAGVIVMLAALLVGSVSAGLAGLVIGLPSLKLRGDYLAIVTLGFNQIIVVILNNINSMGGPAGFNSITVHDQAVLIPGLTSLTWVFVLVAVSILMCIRIRRSTHGLALLAIREDEIAAEAMGVPTTKYKVVAFVMSAVLAGVAGVLFAHSQCYISPNQFNFLISINIVIMVVLGGTGSVSGAAVGAILVVLLPELLRFVDQYRLVIFPALLILMMLVRPKGIFGHEELDRNWLRGQGNGIKKLIGRIRRSKQPAS
jgi:branched-chain amino acid transport system permease protein